MLADCKKKYTSKSPTLWLSNQESRRIPSSGCSVCFTFRVRKSVMNKLAALVRAGGRAYITDFFAKGALSEREQTLLKYEVACPGLLTKDEYIAALKEAGFKIIWFEDVTSEYSTFVHERLISHLQTDKSERREELTQFFTAMDTLYHRGDGESSALGGCRIYLEK